MSISVCVRACALLLDDNWHDEYYGSCTRVYVQIFLLSTFFPLPCSSYVSLSILSLSSPLSLSLSLSLSRALSLARRRALSLSYACALPLALSHAH